MRKSKRKIKKDDERELRYLYVGNPPRGQWMDCKKGKLMNCREIR